MWTEGIEQVFVLPFDLKFSKLNPEEFARRVLVEGVSAAGVLVGQNFGSAQSRPATFRY